MGMFIAVPNAGLVGSLSTTQLAEEREELKEDYEKGGRMNVG